jgi:hypothetical protein
VRFSTATTSASKAESRIRSRLDRSASSSMCAISAASRTGPEPPRPCSRAPIRLGYPGVYLDVRLVRLSSCPRNASVYRPEMDTGRSSPGDLQAIYGVHICRYRATCIDKFAEMPAQVLSRKVHREDG